MRPTTVYVTAGGLALAFGLGFFLAPGVVLPMYGVSPDAATLLMSRFFGVALLQVGVILYLARETRDGSTARALALGGVVGSTAGVIVALTGVVAGTVNALGWSTVAIYGLLLFAYASCLKSRPVPA
jgi:hypothetical protein